MLVRVYNSTRIVHYRLLFRGPISKLAEDMEGDDDHNILELSKTISPTFRRAMSAFIEETAGRVRLAVTH